MLTQSTFRCLVTRNLLFALCGVFLLAGPSAALFAQLAGPNESGVSIAQAHLIVRNPAEHKKLWVDILGTKVTHSGSLELLKLPGIFIVLEQGEPTGGSGGTSVNHLGFLIKDYADIKAKITAAHIEVAADGYKADGCAAAPGTPACQFTVVFPDGVRVEFTEDKTLPVPVANHHIHMNIPDREGVRAWYAKTLGATAGLRRGTIMAAKFPRGLRRRNRFQPSHGSTVGDQGPVDRSYRFRSKRSGGLLQEAGGSGRDSRCTLSPSTGHRIEERLYHGSCWDAHRVDRGTPGKLICSVP